MSRHFYITYHTSVVRRLIRNAENYDEIFKERQSFMETRQSTKRSQTNEFISPIPSYNHNYERADSTESPKCDCDLCVINFNGWLNALSFRTVR